MHQHLVVLVKGNVRVSQDCGRTVLFFPRDTFPNQISIRTHLHRLISGIDSSDRPQSETENDEFIETTFSSPHIKNNVSYRRGVRLFRLAFNLYGHLA